MLLCRSVCGKMVVGVDGVWQGHGCKFGCWVVGKLDGSVSTVCMLFGRDFFRDFFFN